MEHHQLTTSRDGARSSPIKVNVVNDNESVLRVPRGMAPFLRWGPGLLSAFPCLSVGKMELGCFLIRAVSTRVPRRESGTTQGGLLACRRLARGNVEIESGDSLLRSPGILFTVTRTGLE